MVEVWGAASFQMEIPSIMGVQTSTSSEANGAEAVVAAAFAADGEADVAAAAAAAVVALVAEFPAATVPCLESADASESEADFFIV